MYSINELEAMLDLQDCPICGGVGSLEEENGWCYYISCLDCGCHTAEFKFDNDEQRLEAAKSAAKIWGMGKVLSSEPGE